MVARKTVLRKRWRAALAGGCPPCALCGGPIDYSIRYPDPDSFVVDHVVPINAGGTDTRDNIQPAHNRCNRLKSDGPDSRVIKTSGVLK